MRYVDHIFNDHEIRTLQSLLFEYKRISLEYGFVCGDAKTSYVKEMLIREYGDLIGFRERKERNKSELVYDGRGGGDYIYITITSLGISDQQLLQNAPVTLIIIATIICQYYHHNHHHQRGLPILALCACLRREVCSTPDRTQMDLLKSYGLQKMVYIRSFSPL